MDHPNPDKTININNGRQDKPKQPYTHILGFHYIYQL